MRHAIPPPPKDLEERVQAWSVEASRAEHARLESTLNRVGLWALGAAGVYGFVWLVVWLAR